jgi:hypothetical protein
MAAVPITIDGVLYDLYNRTTQRVILMGSGSLTGLGIGGGPILPDLPPVGGQPPVFPPPHPEHPIWGPPGFNPPGPGMPPGIGGGPIIPPDLPPGITPPEPPPPGSPPVLLPPPAGSAGWPVAPIVAPDYIVVNYPGIGPVVVPKPLTGDDSPPAPGRRG